LLKREYSFLESRALKGIIFVIPIVLISVVFLIKIVSGIDDDFYKNLTKEDGVIENATVFVYFYSFIFSLLIAKEFKSKKILFTLFLILGIGFFFIALEEISWGQRMFDFENPDWFPENIQDETTIHNLEVFQSYRSTSYIVVAFMGAFSWIIFPQIKRIVKNVGKNYEIFLEYAVPSKFLFSYFFSVLIYKLTWKVLPDEFVHNYVALDFLIYYDSEFFELILAFGLMLFVFHTFVKIRMSKNPIA
jgi:hypothetical protein